MPLPNRLEMLRRMAAMSLADVASRLKVSENTVRRWEAGAVQIPDTRKFDLSELFDVSIPFLMGWPDANGESNGEGDSDGDAQRRVA